MILVAGATFDQSWDAAMLQSRGCLLGVEDFQDGCGAPLGEYIQDSPHRGMHDLQRDEAPN